MRVDVGRKFLFPNVVPSTPLSPDVVIWKLKGKNYFSRVNVTEEGRE